MPGAEHDGCFRSRRGRWLARLPWAHGPRSSATARPAEPWPHSRGAPRVWTGDLRFDGAVAVSGDAAHLRAWLDPGRRQALKALMREAPVRLWVRPQTLWARGPGPAPTPGTWSRLRQLAALAPAAAAEADPRVAALKAADVLRTVDLMDPEASERSPEGSIRAIFEDPCTPDWLRADALCALWRFARDPVARTDLWRAAARSGRPELTVTALELWPGRDGVDRSIDPGPRAEVLAAVAGLPEPHRSVCADRLDRVWRWRGALALGPKVDLDRPR